MLLLGTNSIIVDTGRTGRTGQAGVICTSRYMHDCAFLTLLANPACLP